MPHGSITFRLVIAYDTRQLVRRLAHALEEAEIESTQELLIAAMQADEAYEIVVLHGCVRSMLRPFAELMMREIVDIAEFKDLSASTRDRLARDAMIAAGYA